MDVLKKIKSATLVEALVATILIVILFIVASLVINNLLLNNFSGNTHQVESRLNELEYKVINGQITIPYNEEFAKWDISVAKTRDESTRQTWIEFRANKENSKKGIIRKRNYASQ